MELKKKSAFRQIMKNLNSAIDNFPDDRAQNSKYTMSNIAMAAYACFHMQNQSFLSNQRYMETTQGKNNAMSLFRIEEIPSDNQIRNILDQVPSSALDQVFLDSFRWLDNQKKLDTYRGINENLLLPLDGTGFFSSDKINCKKCSTKTSSKDGKVQYLHSVITPAIVGINNPDVIPLPPEFIEPQDGHNKQDCENAAAKRWLNQYGSILSKYNVTILGDDLYSNQPLCKIIADNGFKYILVCKYTSHKYLKEWTDYSDSLKDLNQFTIKKWTGKESHHYTYRFAKDVPIKEGKDALKVNWAEHIVTNDEGKILKQFAFITNHEVNKDNVELIIESGRCRWKIENENNNNLKTKGYNIGHSFGHGEKNLANFLLSLNILAFLCHNMMEMFDRRYILLRESLPTRRKFFTDIAALTTYMHFESWDDLLKFMINGLELEDPG
jgi:hypothetical protein